MPYTGDVLRGGPAAVRELDEVVVRKVAVGPGENNAYLLTCRVSGAQLLIDAADDADRLLDLVRAGSRSTRLDLVVTTRRLRSGDVLTVGHLTLEVITLRGHTPGSVALVYREPEQVSRTHPGADGAVPGRAHLFAGDALFPGGLGATGYDPARFASLFDDVTRRIFDRFDDATWVYPGHGADTTLGAERPHLDEWRERGW